MPSKKLISLLHAFSNQNLTRFRKYLLSPYHNENEDLRSFYDFLLKNKSQLLFEGEENTSVQKQIIWKQLFGQKPYEDAAMRRLISELIQQALHFLALEKLQNKPVQEQLSLLDTLKDFKLDLHFNGIVRHITALQEKSMLRNSDFYFYQNQLEERVYQNLEKTEQTPEMLKNLERADSYLDRYYVNKKLKYYCDLIGYQDFLSFGIDTQRILTFMESATVQKYLEEPSIQAYFLTAQMLLHPLQETLFFQLKEHLAIYNHVLNEAEGKSLYIHLINYCIHKKLNIGKLEFFSELFDLLRKALAENILLENDILPAPFYKLIVSAGIQVQEFAWTESFIQTYTPKLPPEEQENALTYNLAKVYFAQQQYEKVIEQLREVEYDNLTYALGGKLMLLKTYYELNEYLALDSLVDSFRVYLRRNQTISKEVRQQYLNVLRFIKKMSNVRPGDRVAIAKIEQQIQECKNLADKGWIVQKMEELKGLKI